MHPSLDQLESRFLSHETVITNRSEFFSHLPRLIAISPAMVPRWKLPGIGTVGGGHLPLMGLATLACSSLHRRRSEFRIRFLPRLLGLFVRMIGASRNMVPAAATDAFHRYWTYEMLC